MEEDFDLERRVECWEVDNSLFLPVRLVQEECFLECWDDESSAFLLLLVTMDLPSLARLRGFKFLLELLWQLVSEMDAIDLERLFNVGRLFV